MLVDSKDPVVKTAQPTMKTGRKLKVVETVDQAKECLEIKEVIEIRLNVDSRRVQKAVKQPQQGQSTN